MLLLLSSSCPSSFILLVISVSVPIMATHFYFAHSPSTRTPPTKTDIIMWVNGGANTTQRHNCCCCCFYRPPLGQDIKRIILLIPSLIRETLYKWSHMMRNEDLHEYVHNINRIYNRKLSHSLHLSIVPRWFVSFPCCPSVCWLSLKLIHALHVLFPT